MRVAVYRILYGEDYIQESIRSILPVVDKIVVAKAERPWGTSAGVTWKDEWVSWPVKFDATRDRIVDLREPNVEVIDDQWPSPAGQHSHIVNDIVVPRYHPDEVMLIEPDHVFASTELRSAMAEWTARPRCQQATTRMIELWKTPAWRIAERHRASVLFHRLDGKPMAPTSGDGGQSGISSHWLQAQVHNLGFAMSERTTYWKHLTATAFATEIGDAPPDPEWYEKKWLEWTPETRDLEISLGGQHTIECAVPYDWHQAPEGVQRKFNLPPQ